MIYGIQTLYETFHWIDSCCVDYWLITDTVLLNLCANDRSNYKLLYGFLKVLYLYNEDRATFLLLAFCETQPGTHCK